MHITKASRDHYQFSSDFFRPDGRISLGDFASARKFAGQMTALRSQSVPASDLYALSLIDEALRALVRRFAPPPVMTTAISRVDESLGEESIAATERKFVAEYPPEVVYRGDEKIDEYIAKLSNGKIRTAEELIYVFTHNANPALQSLLELVDDDPLETTAYKKLIASLESVFAQIAKDNAGISGISESLFEILRAPAEAFPDSLERQLQFIIEKWGGLLGEDFVARLLRGVDFLREETLRHQLAHGDFKADIPVASYSGGNYAEYERYSPDKDWMPRLILIAKNSYVWLEQLSRKHWRWIKTLDQIPDE